MLILILFLLAVDMGMAEEDTCLEVTENENLKSILEVCLRETSERLPLLPHIRVQSVSDVQCLLTENVFTCLTDEVVKRCGEDIRQFVYEFFVAEVNLSDLGVDESCITALASTRERRRPQDFPVYLMPYGR